jgi:glycosyltransferase involved in cell wall biosynthesis
VLDRTLHYPAFARRAGERAAALVRSGRAAVVDAQGAAGVGYARLRRRRPGPWAPLVVNPQGMEEHKTTGLKRLALAPLRALSREAARLADRVVATDEATRAEVPRLLGVDPRRVVVLPNGIDPDELRAATPRDPAALVDAALPALRGASPVLLSVGRLEAYKGFGDVLEALMALDAAGRLPPSAAWVVVGDGPLRPALAARAAGLRARVILPGRLDETMLHALYERADVFVHATRFEGSSLVTLEAMAHGLPVVATRAGGIPDKVKDGVNGYLVNPGDVEALSAAIVKMANAPEDRARMRKETLQLLDPFLWPHIAKRVIAQYERLLQERKKR